jgi:nicotinamide mononucleotide transporter
VARVFAISVCITATFGLIAARFTGRPSALELVGTVTGLCNVWLLRKQNALAWPFGITSVIAVGTVFHDLGLIGQAWLHFFYFAPINAWAWFHWVRGGKDRTRLEVSWTPWREWLLYLPFFLIGTYFVGTFFSRVYERAIFVFWDASIVVFSIVAQWLMSRKKIESWMLWVGPVDASAIVLFSLTGAHMFSALYVVFLLNASVAVYEWSDSWKSVGSKHLGRGQAPGPGGRHPRV